jgi:hypothetical protein
MQDPASVWPRVSIGEEENMTRISITWAIVLVACPVAAQSAAGEQAGHSPPVAAAQIRHVPINEVEEGDISLAFELESPDFAGEIVVRVTPIGAGRQPFEAVARRTAGGYHAKLEAARIGPPGFTYYVVERMPDHSERAVFADKSAPHRVHVNRPPELEAELERLAARGGQRSTVLLSGEVVDFGDRQLGAKSALMHDRYYRLEAGYAYSFLSNVEEIRLSLVRVRGEAASFSSTPTPSSVATEPGIDYGRAMVGMLVSEDFRLRGAVLLGASQRGFEYGGGGALVIGSPVATNLELGVEAMTTLGATAHLRLGFLATSKIPMGATLAVTNFPIGGDAGVRLLYDVGYRFGPVTMLSLRAGYQGRTSVSGGPALALNLEYGF